MPPQAQAQSTNDYGLEDEKPAAAQAPAKTILDPKYGLEAAPEEAQPPLPRPKPVVDSTKPTQFENDRKWLGFSPGHVAREFVGGVKDVGGFIHDAAKDISDPNRPLIFGGDESGPHESVLHKYAIAPAERENEKAARATNPLESFGHSVAAAIPGVGPLAAAAGEQMGTGDVGGAIGRVGGQLAAGKLGEKAAGGVIGKVAELPKPALTALGESIRQRSPMPIKDAIMAPKTAPGLSVDATANLNTSPGVREGAEKIFNAAKPTASMPNFRENLATALPDLKAIEEKTAADATAKAGEKQGGLAASKGGVINPDFRLRQTVSNIRTHLDDLWQKERQPQIDKYADDPAMGRSELGLSPDEIKAVESRMGRKIPEHMTLQEADHLLKDGNAFLQKTNAMSDEGRALATAVSPILDSFDRMHDRLLERIGNVLRLRGEPGVEDFNKRYAALSGVRDALQRQVNPAEYNTLFNQGFRLIGGVNGPGILERLHIKPSPGRNLQRGMERLAASKLPTPQVPTNTIPAEFRRPAPTGGTGPFALQNEQTPYAQQQPLGDLWAGPPSQWAIAEPPGGGGPLFPTEPGPARPAPGVNLHTDPRVAENMRAAANPPGVSHNAAGAVENTGRGPVPEESSTILPGRTATATKGALPAERVQPNTAPPPVEEQFRREGTGTVQDPRMLGGRGEEGTRGPILMNRQGPGAPFPGTRGIPPGKLSGPIIEMVPHGTPDVFGANPQAELAAVEPEIRAREARQAERTQGNMRDAAAAFESQPATQVPQAAPVKPTGDVGSLSDRFNQPSPQVPKLKGGINAQGYEASTRPTNPVDVAESLDRENADVRERIKNGNFSEDEKRQANERIQQNEERAAELRGKKGNGATRGQVPPIKPGDVIRNRGGMMRRSILSDKPLTDKPAASFRAGTDTGAGEQGYTVEDKGGTKWAVDPNGVRVSIKGSESPAEIKSKIEEQVRLRAQMQKDLFGK